MKPVLKIAAIALIAAMVVCACAMPASSTSSERSLSDALRLYRDSSLVVIGRCLETVTDGAGATSSLLSVERVLAGSADEGDTVRCSTASMKKGENYLLYLSEAEGEGAHYAEDSVRYDLVSDSPVRILGGENVVISGTRLALEDIEGGISSAMKVVASEAVSYFYTDLGALSAAASDIFIGRVTSVPEAAPVAFRSDSGGASVENELSASIVTIEADGSLKGAINYGDAVKYVFCADMCAGMTDAVTLESVACDSSYLPKLNVGSVYIFFLNKGPDAKQDYYFPVNQFQGCAALTKSDTVAIPYANKALYGYYELDKLVNAVRGYVNG